MTPEVASTGFTELQRELFEATGLVFEIKADEKHVGLSFDGVHVLNLPFEALMAPVKTVRSFRFPRHLQNGPTLAQRCSILRALAAKAESVADLHALLGNEPGDDLRKNLMRIVDLESQTRDAVCTLVWSLNDLAVQRLSVRLGAGS